MIKKKPLATKKEVLEEIEKDWNKSEDLDENLIFGSSAEEYYYAKMRKEKLQ